jgi:hypothetical protein
MFDLWIKVLPISLISFPLEVLANTPPGLLLANLLTGFHLTSERPVDCSFSHAVGRD